MIFAMGPARFGKEACLGRLAIILHVPSSSDKIIRFDTRLGDGWGRDCEGQGKVRFGPGTIVMYHSTEY